MKFRLKFSAGWFLGGAIIHAAVTILLCLANFTAGMGAFTTGPSADQHFTRQLQWMWTPLAMSVWNPRSGNSDESMAFLLAVLWSGCVGILVGFLAPLYRK